MNKATLMIPLLGLFIVAVPIYGQIPTGTTSVAFAGYCDGATITYSGSGSFISGTHDNYDCAGSQTFIAGVAATDSRIASVGFKPTLVANMTDNLGVLVFSGAGVQFYLDFSSSGFSFYKESDSTSPEKRVVKGTFTIVSQPVARYGGVAAWQEAGEPDDSDTVGDAGFPKGTYDIVLTDHCDYLHVTTKGNTVGGVHDFATNCGLINAPVAANNATLSSDVAGTAGASLVGTDNEYSINGSGDEPVNFYFNFTNMTFAVYGAVDSSGLFLISTGTFSITQNGPPAGRGLPVSTGMKAKQ